MTPAMASAAFSSKLYAIALDVFRPFLRGDDNLLQPRDAGDRGLGLRNSDSLHHNQCSGKAFSKSLRMTFP
jgi:hypothetical protein